MTAEATHVAEQVVAILTRRGETLAVAESLTGGLVAAAITSVPGSSAVLRGAVVAYATDLKHVLLGVGTDLLAREGAVSPDVALEMAQGVARVLGATWGLATTGVAGPDPQDGHAVGEVWIAVSHRDSVAAEVARAQVDPGSGRAAIRDATVVEVLTLLMDRLEPISR
jgi:nicotinamide-nucleotide amidase